MRLHRKHLFLVLAIMLSMFLFAPPSASLREFERASYLRDQINPDGWGFLPSEIAYQDVRIAVYSESDTSLPAYATGGTYTNNYNRVYNLLDALGYQVTQLHTAQILAGLLVTADYDVLVLVDNLPRDGIVNKIMDFWLGGGSILTFNSAIGFLFHTGMLDKSFEGSFELTPPASPGMWAYGLIENSTIAERHPVTIDFAVDDVLSDIEGNLTIWNKHELPGILGDRLITLAMHPDFPTIGHAFAYDDPDRGGKIVQLPGDCSVIPDSIRAMTLAAIDWLNPRPKARVLFDLSHQPYYGVDSWDPLATHPSRFFDWRDLLVNRSYTFDKLTTSIVGELTPDRLKKYDLLVLNLPQVNFTQDEFTAIWEWVNDGGGLLAMGDFSGAFGFSNMVISSICSPFGLGLHSGADYEAIMPTKAGNHPVHESASSLSFYGGSYVNHTGSAFPLYVDGPNTAIAASTHGEGRIILAGDVQVLTTDIGDSPSNVEYGINAANWLASGDAEVLAYVDTSSLPDPNNNIYTGPVAQALCDLGIKFQIHHSMFYFDYALQEKGWDMVVIDNINHAISSYFDELFVYVEGGGKLVISTWLYSSSSGAPLFAYLGFEYAGATYDYPPEVHIWEEEHPIFYYPHEHGESYYNASTDFGYGTEGAYLSTFPNATALAGFSVSPSTDNASIILGAEGRAISNAMLLTFYTDDVDDSTYSDAVELWAAEIAYLYFERPQLSEQADIEYEAGSTGYFAEWAYTSDIPAYYELRINGYLEERGRVTDPIFQFSVDGYGPGTYLYQLIVYDRVLYPVSDSFELRVTDTVLPTISSPADITYVYNTTGHEIVWTVNDNYPHIYNLYLDDVLIDSQIWTSGTITISVDGLEIGVYEYTLEIFDTSGNSASDTVMVRVTSGVGIDPMLLALVGGGLVLVVIVILVLYKAKKGSKPK